MVGQRFVCLDGWMSRRGRGQWFQFLGALGACRVKRIEETEQKDADNDKIECDGVPIVSVLAITIRRGVEARCTDILKGVRCASSSNRWWKSDIGTNLVE